MTSSSIEYPDFAQPVGILDESNDYTGGLVSTGGGVLGPFDTSRVGTLFARLQVPDLGAVAGVQGVAEVTWIEGGVAVTKQGFTYHSKASYSNDTAELFAVLPVLASQVQFSALTSDGSTGMVQIIGSTRQPPPGPRMNNPLYSRTRRLLSAAPGVIAAGASAGPYYLPPVGREVLFRLNQRSATMTVTVNAVTVESGLFAVTPLVTFSGLDQPNMGVAVPAPFMGLEVMIANNDTVGHTTTLAAWDVS